MKAYVTGIEYVLPERVVYNSESRLTKKTGIIKRHIAAENETASDLAYKAAEKLLKDEAKKQSIDFLLFCTQSPDHYLPTTACILQDRLGLPRNCGAFDYNLGCSGYIYGLSIAKGLIESGQAQNVLLLTAETYSKYIDPQDHSVEPLFGDAATATSIAGFADAESGLDGFVLGTDGSGYDKLIVPVGGSRQPHAVTPLQEETDEFGNHRTNRNLYMNGAAISDFALDVVPQTVENILKKTGSTKEDIDYYVFHQANKFILKFLQMKCDLGMYPYWNDVKEYGNTVSCSVPIALADMMKASTNIGKVMALGFGVGLSWGGCIIDMKRYEQS